MQRKNKKGFTLVEIMIVVVIIGLLAAMAIPAFQEIRRSSVQSTMDNDARQIASAAQQYFMDDPDITTIEMDNILGSYMTELSDGVSLVTDASGTTEATTIASGASFFLQHRDVNGGAGVEYNEEGRRVDP
ncbi:MAG: prepilin-type N-terminal cleavage/methylation domain-containing protein [Opitutales bacterium]